MVNCLCGTYARCSLPLLTSSYSLLETLIQIHQLTSCDNIVDVGCGVGLIPLYYSLRFGKPALGIELRPELDSLAHDIESLVEYSARRWGLWMPVPRRIIGDVLVNAECQLGLAKSTFVILNNFKFDPQSERTYRVP